MIKKSTIVSQSSRVDFYVILMLTKCKKQYSCCKTGLDQWHPKAIDNENKIAVLVSAEPSKKAPELSSK
jgi:hypothetical protein